MKYIKTGFLVILSLIVITITVGYVMYKRSNMEVLELTDAARKNVAGSFTQLSDGVTHYELAGNDSSKVIVLIHGFSVPYYIWDSTFTALVNAGFRVLRYDAFGRGFSDRPDKLYDAAFYRLQLFELLAKLQIHSVYAIAGVSFGGAVAADFVRYNPGMVTKIILIDPVYPRFSQSTSAKNLMLFKMAMKPNDQANGQLTDLQYPAKFPQWAAQYKVQMQYKGFRNALVSTLLNYAPEGTISDNYRAVDSLHKPVLLIWGKEDSTVLYKFSDSLRQILHTRFFAVDGAAHLPQMEKASIVNDKIIAFLKSETGLAYDDFKKLVADNVKVLSERTAK